MAQTGKQIEDRKVGRFMKYESVQHPEVARVVIDHLSLLNRAYQVLYTLGENSSTVRTLDPGEAAALVGIVQDIRERGCLTQLDWVLQESMSPGMNDYVAGREAK